MTDMKSPIVQYYPDQFEQDLNGKRNDWEAVVLIPFIEEHLLLKAMNERDGLLTNEEKMRNSRGLMCCYRYTVKSFALLSPTQTFSFDVTFSDTQKTHPDQLRLPGTSFQR